MILVVLWLLALAGCAWLFVASARLFFRGFSRAFGIRSQPRAFGPPVTPRVDGGPEPHTAAGAQPVAHPVPGWTAKMIEAHIGHCQPCRHAMAEYIAGINPTGPVPSLETVLGSLEPPTITRIVHIVESEDAQGARS